MTKSSLPAALARLVVYSFLVFLVVYAFKLSGKYRWDGYSYKAQKDNITIYSGLPKDETDRYLGACLLFREYFDREILFQKNKKLTVYLFADTAGYSAYCNKIGVNISEYGFYMKGRGVITVNAENGMDTLFHEMVHYFIDTGGYEMPYWTEEGIASFYEKFMGYYADETDYMITFGYFSPYRIKEVKDNRARLGISSLNTNQSIAANFIMYLYQEGKLRKFLGIYFELKNDREAIAKTFGKDIKQVEKEWLEWFDGLSFDDDNVVFAHESRLFRSKAGFDDFLQKNRAVWDDVYKMYRVRY
ncbi:MAG: hypothetical protein A2297_05325 [Elusimicrobia bacterium RIFOXYB2_FULL_48_7]|nr:MAG: hypothetical protein A2297_05325 [Elusimicrobia bacterium RIFOXYB2_FULL_48_7]